MKPKNPLYYLDRADFPSLALATDPDDREYWLAKTPAERLEAAELMRQLLYGYDPATIKFQKVFEIVDFSPNQE